MAAEPCPVSHAWTSDRNPDCRRSAERSAQLGDHPFRIQTEKLSLIRPRRMEHEVAESQLDIGSYPIHLFVRVSRDDPAACRPFERAGSGEPAPLLRTPV